MLKVRSFFVCRGSTDQPASTARTILILVMVQPWS